MKWIKKGRIYNPSQIGNLTATHAQCPIPLVLEDRLRLYFAWRPPVGADGQYTSYGGFIDVDREDPSRILYEHGQPILPLGQIGDFDHYGCMPGSVVALDDGRMYLYYCGWDRRVSTPYNWAIGMAVSEDGGVSFRRIGKGPVLGATQDEPYLQACPMVRIIDGLWHMWYLSGTEWLVQSGVADSVYVLMHATSKEGICWQREGRAIMPTRVEHECQTSATVQELNGVRHMWFSYRHGTDFRNPARGYRIGHATSTGLEQWTRDDTSAGITLSDEGWDAEMQCYPSVITVGAKTYMFYCGNRFGSEGFGYAELQG